MASTRKTQCPCCKHAAPHCRCRGNRPPPAPPAPVTVKPNPCSIIGWANLAELAWAFYKLNGVPVTVNAVAGAIRALQLRNDVLARSARVRGCVLFRQQTMVHPSQFQRIYDHLEERI